MENEILPYVESCKQEVKSKISVLLTSTSTKQIAASAFKFHFSQNQSSSGFQEYYYSMVANRRDFLSSKDFFRTFKQKYSLQGIDTNYLDRLENEKKQILQLIDNSELAILYFRYFAKAQIQRGQQTIPKRLGSFFAKLVHTFKPDEYCALDNPIKKHFGLDGESFYIAFTIVSSAYKEWAVENPHLISQIRTELELTPRGKSYSSKTSNLKLLDLIFWKQANNGE